MEELLDIVKPVMEAGKLGADSARLWDLVTKDW